jgi:hypothetical protein
VIVSEPLDGAVTVTWQLAWFGAPVGAREQVPPVTPPVPVTVTVPDGTDAAPPGSVSVTVSVATLDAVARTALGESDRTAVVWRPLTARVRVCVAVCGVGEVESVAWTVKAKLPAAVGVPEIVPPESVRPSGSAPD